MIIFPAIDIKDGVCVRLMQGDPERMTVYGKDPVLMAKRWEEEGARWLHLVDLDGAFSRTPVNRRVIAAIVEAVNIPVQVGGGIRTLDTVRDYLESGVERVILGTAALRQPETLERACGLYPLRIALGIDARDGMVAIEGWKETSGTSAVALAKSFEKHALAAIIYTDIQRDGMQSGVNIEATKRLLDSCSIPVIASGGVSTLKDIQDLMPLVPLGLLGVITGKAIYSGTLQFKEALAWIRGGLENT